MSIIVVVLLFLIGLIEVYAQHDHHTELLEDSYHHHYNDEVRRLDNSNVKSRQNQMNKLSTTVEATRKANVVEGCCDGIDPLIIQEVQELVQNFGISWEGIMQKYNVKPLSTFTKKLNGISEAVINLGDLVGNMQSIVNSEDEPFVAQSNIFENSNIQIPSYNPPPIYPEYGNSNILSMSTYDPDSIIINEVPDYDTGSDTSEEEYVDDGRVIPDKTNAIQELRRKIKNLLESLGPRPLDL
ncbi:unnamed protein product [Diamesa serratosioi]